MQKQFMRYVKKTVINKKFIVNKINPKLGSSFKIVFIFG